MAHDGEVNPIAEWMLPSRWGLRIRSAVACALVVGVISAAAAGAMLWFLRESLIRELDTTADARAGAVAAELVRTSAPRPPEELLSTEGRIAAIQVLDPDGRVLAASGPKFTTPLLADPKAVGDRGIGLRAARGYDDDWRIAARAAATTAGRYLVLVAADSESAEHAVTEVAVLLAIGGPIVVAAAAAATYLLVGRSLRSVEDIRARVAGIGTADLSERVPVPLARDEIARLAETMNDMLARVQSGHDAQRRFVGDASHELRSPLATLTAALELARDRPQILDGDLIGATLLPEAERMKHLVDDLLTLAAADEGGLELRRGEVDLDDIAESEAAALRMRATVTVRTAIAPVRVIGDRARLARAVRNIVDNAAAHARSRIALVVERTDGRARIIVVDDGPGIAPRDRARVFDRFVRLQADRSRGTGGSGLGLAIVAEIVAAHGGTVEATQSPWGGARFVIELPVGVEEAVSDSA
ncbi:ATP-binding protein [Nocardia sp. NPDC051570]|uniref:sensor histidine kinase n=1 Tax=Nocardia sp. NPDC051570 TaxID=3364324 RepID=UPI0037944578